MTKIPIHPLAPLSIFSVVLTAFLATYLATGFSPSTTFEIASSFSWSLLLAFWVVTDARRREGIPCFDFGFFCYLFPPIVVPWYCFWSRGWRGTLLLATIVCLWLMPYVVASMLWLALYGRR